MKGLIYLLIAGVLVLFSCKQYSAKNENNTSREDSLHQEMDMPKEGDVLPDSYTTDNSKLFVGTYEGVLPCATCAGIETEIQLFQDSTYVIKTHIQGSNSKPLVREGKCIIGPPSLLTLEGVTDESNMYFIGDDFLRHLDMQGREITGYEADKYILKKVK